MVVSTIVVDGVVVPTVEVEVGELFTTSTVVFSIVVVIGSSVWFKYFL